MPQTIRSDHIGLSQSATLERFDMWSIFRKTIPTPQPHRVRLEVVGLLDDRTVPSGTSCCMMEPMMMETVTMNSTVTMAVTMAANVAEENDETANPIVPTPTLTTMANPSITAAQLAEVSPRLDDSRFATSLPQPRTTTEVNTIGAIATDTESVDTHSTEIASDTDLPISLTMMPTLIPDPLVEAEELA